MAINPHISSRLLLFSQNIAFFASIFGETYKNGKTLILVLILGLCCNKLHPRLKAEGLEFILPPPP
jgi:hypothetical protein